MKAKNILATGVLATAMLTACDVPEEETEIATESIEATRVTVQTRDSVQQILEIKNPCEDGRVRIVKHDTKNNTLTIEYECQEGEKIQLNGVTQFPKIPGIPTGAPVPGF